MTNLLMKNLCFLQSKKEKNNQPNSLNFALVFFCCIEMGTNEIFIQAFRTDKSKRANEMCWNREGEKKRQQKQSTVLSTDKQKSTFNLI